MNSRQICSLACVTVLLVALFPAAGFCTSPLQWDTAGVPLRQGAGIGAYSVAQNSQGYSLVVWCDLHNGNDDLFAQLISPAGVPQWAEGGVVVVAHPSEQVNPVAVAVNGGWIVFWIDHRHGCGSNVDPGWGDIYAQKLSDSGQILWTANQSTGIAVDINTSTQVSPSERLVAVADGSGGALVAWSSITSWYNVILAQHVSGGGQVLWASPLAVADTVAAYHVVGAGDEDGNLYLAWCENRDHQRVRCAKTTADGQRAWGGAGRIVNALNNDVQGNPSICPDGQGGCYVAWCGFNDGVYQSDDVLVQRLSASGDALWAAGGVAACAARYTQESVNIALSRNGSLADGCLLAWEDYRSLVSDEIFVQKMSPAGIALWSADGLLITPYGCGGGDDPVRLQPAVVSDGLGGLVCFWQDNIHGLVLDGDLYSTRVAADGSRPWGTSCIPVWAEVGAQSSAVPVPGTDGTFVFWIDIAPGVTSLRYQHLHRGTGSLTLGEGGVVLHSGICGMAEQPRSLMLSPGRYAAVWEDTRRWTDRELYYQIFDADGQPLGPVNGSRLTPEHSTVDQRQASLCSDGNGGFYALFIHDTAGVQRARLAHVNSAGNLVSPPAGIPVSPDMNTNGDLAPLCVPDREGGCFAVWTAYDEMYRADVWVQRFNASGATVWAQPRMANETDSADCFVCAVVEGPGGSCHIVYSTGSDESEGMHGVNLQPSGAVLWRTMLRANAPHSYGFKVVPDGADGYFCAWTSSEGWELATRAQHVSASGALLWPADGALVSDDRAGYRLDLAPDPHGNLFVTWIGTSLSQPDRIYVQKLNPSGARIWAGNGREIGGEARPWEYLKILPDAGDGLFVCWDDLRGLRPHIYGTHLDSAGATVANAYWANGGGLISTSWDAQEEPVVCADGYGGMIATYVDNKGIEEVIEPPQIYAQRIFDGITSAPEPPAGTPREFALHQNYPNPFNPTTVIAFDLAREGRSTLEVFDLLGRRVTTLVDGVLAAGEHRVTFDAAGLPSGTYIYRLQSADFTQSRKMLLLK